MLVPDKYSRLPSIGVGYQTVINTGARQHIRKNPQFALHPRQEGGLHPRGMHSSCRTQPEFICLIADVNL